MEVASESRVATADSPPPPRTVQRIRNSHSPQPGSTSTERHAPRPAPGCSGRVGSYPKREDTDVHSSSFEVLLVFRFVHVFLLLRQRVYFWVTALGRSDEFTPATAMTASHVTVTCLNRRDPSYAFSELPIISSAFLLTPRSSDCCSCCCCCSGCCCCCCSCCC